MLISPPGRSLGLRGEPGSLGFHPGRCEWAAGREPGRVRPGRRPWRREHSGPLPPRPGPGLHGLLCRGCDESEDGSHCAGGVQAGGHPFRREAASDDQIRSCDTDRCHLLSQAQARCEASMRLKFTGGQPGARHLVPSFPLVCGQGTATAWVSGSGPATPNS